ncbi:MAG: hypothetical protein ABI451_10175, partial [Dokdonella sp.]
MKDPKANSTLFSAVPRSLPGITDGVEFPIVGIRPIAESWRKLPMKTACIIVGTISALHFCHPASAQSQMPLCPDAAAVTFGFNETVPPGPVPGNFTLVTIEKFFSPPPGFNLRVFDYWAENIERSGDQIDFDARGAEVGNFGQPAHFDSLGVIPAGQYTVTIHPIATNVTPNVTCPELVIPIAV